MKKILIAIFTAIAASCYVAQAQEPIQKQELVYCMLKANQNEFNNKVIVSIDLGQDSRLSANAENQIVDENGKYVKFKTVIDALNFMSSLGWKYVDGSSYSAQGVAVQTKIYEWLLVKSIAPGADPFEGITTKAMYDEQHSED